jgi:hypothetical protein
MTMYHLAHNATDRMGRPPYQKVEVEVMNIEDIPEMYRKLRFYDGTEKTLHPYAPQKRRNSQKYSRYDGTSNSEIMHGQNTRASADISSNNTMGTMPLVTKWFESLEKKNLIILIVATICFLASLKPLGKNIERISNWINTEKVVLPIDKTNKTPPAHTQQPLEGGEGIADETSQTPPNGNSMEAPQNNQNLSGDTNKH